MWVETHRCAVDGCPNRAAYEVLHWYFDPVEGAVSFEPDETCPALCVEHALENERGAEGERRTDAVLRYPHTNRGGEKGLSIYRQLEAHYADEQV
jgi:hypothetical protein